MTTWEKELTRYFKETKDSFDVMDCTLSKDELKAEFDDDFGTVPGKPFVAHTPKYVYFSSEYDGSEFISYVPRHPTGELKVSHVE